MLTPQKHLTNQSCKWIHGTRMTVEKLQKGCKITLFFFIVISVQEQVNWNIAPDERDKFGYRIAKENASAATSKFTLGLRLIWGFEIKKINLAQRGGGSVFTTRRGY